MSRLFQSAQEVLGEFAELGLSPKFCHVPFVSLILEPDGRVGSCRMKGTEFPVGNLNTQSLEEIWNGPRIREWRREFLSGKVRMCGDEVRYKGCNTCPEYNSLLSDVKLEEVQSQKPLRLTLNLNGQCNLECRMCHIWKEPNGLYHSKGWLKQVEGWIDGIHELELLSGEPFMQRDTYQLIDVISQKNPNCLWSITSNGHWRLTEKIRQSLDKIQFKHLIVSLDSLDPEIYPKIRKKGDLRIPLGTLDQLIEYDRSRIDRGMGSLNIHLSFLVQRDNWHEIGNFHDFALEKGVKIFRIFLLEPLEHSILSLPETERVKILDFYFSTLRRDQLTHSMRIVLPILDSLSSFERANYLLEFKKRISAA